MHIACHFALRGLAQHRLSDPRRLIAVLTLLAATLANASALGNPPRPQDDFYAYVNHEWPRHTAIPPDVPWISPFVDNTLRIQREIRALIENAAIDDHPSGSIRQLLADYYRSRLYAEKFQGPPMSVLSRSFASIDTLGSTGRFGALLAHLLLDHTLRATDARLPEITPIALQVWTDRRRPTRTVLVVLPSGLGLWDRDAYRARDNALTETYRRHIRHTLALAGVPSPERAADQAFSIEVALAAARRPEEALHDARASWHPMTQTDLERRYPALEWASMLLALEIDKHTHIVVTEPAFLDALNELVRSTAPEVWRSYFRWQLLRRYAALLGPDLRNAAFAFYEGRLLGKQLQRSPQDRASLATEQAFPQQVGRLWVDRYVDSRSRLLAIDLAESVRRAFDERLAQATWMTAASRQAARRKLANMQIKVAYPDKWEPAPPVDISPTDPIGNQIRLNRYRWQQDLERLSAPVDRDRWLDVPQSTNAYYSRSTNELAIPAGYLQPPFFDPQAPLAANLGGIGTVIGHEMGHAFDDQGSQYDALGRLSNGWQPGDEHAFQRKTNRLIQQYAHYEPIRGHAVNGQLTISENIADLTGVSVAHAALLEHGGADTPRDLLAIQRTFFEAYCRRLRARYTDALLRRILAADSHAPNQFRCNGPLSNFNPFYQVYGVSPGDGMYRPPEERVSLW